MASPKPSPPWARVLEVSSWANRLNTCGKNPRIDSHSRIADRDPSSPSTTSSSNRHFPFSLVNLMAFVSRFETTCCRRTGSPETIAGDLLSSDVQFDRFPDGDRVASSTAARTDPPGRRA